MNDDLTTLEPTLLRAIWRYRWLVLFITLVSASAAWWYAGATSTDEFVALASIQVQDPSSTIAGPSVSTQVQQQYVRDQTELLKSGEVAQRAQLLATGLDEEFPYDASGITEQATINQVQDSSVIAVRFRASGGDWAIIGANSIIAAYEDLVRSELQRNTETSLQIIDQLIEEKRVEGADTQEQIDALTTERSEGRIELGRQLDDLIEELVSLNDQLDATVSEETRAALNVRVLQVRDQVDAMRAVIAALSESQQVQQLVESHTRLEDQIDTLERDRQEIVISSARSAGAGSIKTEALEAAPVQSNLQRLLIVGVFLGMLVGSGFAYLLALRRRTITDRTQPELVLAAPLIAAVPNFLQEGIRSALPVRTDPRSASAEAFRFAAAGLDFSRPITTGGLITAGKVVAVTSAGLADGKSVVATNTALAAAKEGKRVLLIDADFGNQATTMLLLPDERPAAGLTEVVEVGMPLHEAVVQIEGSGSTGLHLLARGWRQTTAPEFFRLGATREFFEQVQDYYDLVIVDSPPVLHMAYASTLLGLVDKVLIVVPHESSATLLEELQDRLDLVGTPTIGYIYNLAPLRPEMTRTEGSMRDVLGGAAELPT
ncbi:MAG TPA: AAA family ATPase [Acidimicrobiia bacterium]|jgi:Mrp family chromosome partitioning ATPase